MLPQDLLVGKLEPEVCMFPSLPPVALGNRFLLPFSLECVCGVSVKRISGS